MLKANALSAEESSLTGESVPVQKQAQAIQADKLEMGDQKNMAFMGTLITQGNGTGVVIATGMNTEMGKIAHLLQTTQSLETPLQRRLEQLGKILIIIALLLTAMVVAAGVLQGYDIYTMFLSGVSLAVAAIPEGLPAILRFIEYMDVGTSNGWKYDEVITKQEIIERLHAGGKEMMKAALEGLEAGTKAGSVRPKLPRNSFN